MYSLVYAGIQLGKTFESSSGVIPSKLIGVLCGATCTLSFAPTLAVLFIGARMSALQIQFQDTPQTQAVVERIESKYRRLERLCGTILNCRVVVAQPHRHQRKGRRYCVSIELSEQKPAQALT